MFGSSAAMMSPVPLPPLVAKPEMWSLWRWVATTAWSFALGALPDVVRDVHHAVLGTPGGKPVEPKSISTWRSAPP